MHKRKPQRKGFTLMELLVAVTLLGLMLFLVNELFQSTSVAVTTSVQTSKVIATTRIVGEQVDADTADMFGPGPNLGNGYMVILQRRITNVPMLNPDNLAEVAVDQVRSDQVMFIRDAGGLRSMTPQSGGTYQTNLVGQPGGYAKVWYGHVQRTLNDGTVPTGAATGLGGADSGFDRIGSDWILGRQAMLFNPVDELELLLRRRTDPSVAGSPNSYTHADNAFATSLVRNSDDYPGNKRTALGLTDVTVQDYGTLVGTLQNPALPLNTLNQIYLGTTYYSTTLRANPSPTDTGYEPWAIAQSHPILATNCSDFIVQFAADLNGNGRIDSVAGGNADRAEVFWYDSLALNYPQPTWNNSTWRNLTDPRFQPYVSIDANTRAFIFKVDDDAAFSAGQPTSAWPYLIRIRYRLHGNRGRVVGNDPGALTDGLDNNGNGQRDEFGEDRIAGQWFEHVIRVARPPSN